jgi:DNA-binding CsgD family transcriptional regulator
MVTPTPLLERGRVAYDREEWRDAYAVLVEADEDVPLGAGDLELLGRAAYMLGLDEEYVDALERAHDAYERGQSPAQAARCAWWIGHSLLFRGQGELARGWFRRGERLLDNADLDCVERGYLLIPVWLRQMGRGEWEAGEATAVAAAEIGERFGDADLVWLARDEQGRAMVRQGRVDEGMALVSEVLAVIRSGGLSPVVSGIIYCNTIDFCRDAGEIRHTRAWTDALDVWCQARPQMVAHNGLCLVHRAEMLQFRGDWRRALAEAMAAADRFTRGVLNQIALGKAHYRQGEIHRLQGNTAEAEHAYERASRHGCDPVPGLALLRLAQGRVGDAVASIRRAVSEQVQPLERAALLPAYVEVMVAAADMEAARAAADQLSDIAVAHPTDALAATAAATRALAGLSAGDATRALTDAREAWRRWHELDAPYEVGRARVLVGLACRALGDEDGARLELAAAEEAFLAVAALPDVARVQTLRHGRGADTHGLSQRELAVLRLVASGLSNQAIAAHLVISPHTVARHLQNIFTKIGVSSRTAATRFAFESDLVRGDGRGQD